MRTGYFLDRRDAGRILALQLSAYLNRTDVIVLALPPDGVPVGYEVAHWLNAPLDVFFVRSPDPREQLYRSGRGQLEVRGRTAIVVDDGAVTGATMRAAIDELRRREQPARIVAALPVAPPQVCQQLRAIADEAVCVFTPEPFHNVEHWYRNYPTVPDDEVAKFLARAQAGQWEGAPA
jgi:putative phosphoribosyl transferase